MCIRDRIMIIGSGFGGSILAAILAKAGITVVLVDHQSHPRFAIGESSTPTATFILKSLVKHYQLTELEALTSYGLWKQKLFQVGCGVKRGFSYFFHSPGSPVQTTDLHQKEEGLVKSDWSSNLRSASENPGFSPACHIRTASSAFSWAFASSTSSSARISSWPSPICTSLTI